jgi:hypothetical protein
MRLGVIAAALPIVLACAVLPAAAQPAEAPSGAAPTPPAMAATVPATLPVGTPMVLEITQTLDSKITKRGDRFTIRLIAPIALNGQVVVPAGVTGEGQIVDAAPSGAMGRPAKMLLAARYLDFNGAQIPIRGMHLGKAGDDKTNTIMAASVALGVLGLPAMFLPGGDIVIPAGTLGQAKLAVAIDASGAFVAPATPAAAAAAPAAPTPSTSNPSD